MSLQDSNDILVFINEYTEHPYHVIKNVIWYKDQFAGTMYKHIISGIIISLGPFCSVIYIIFNTKIQLNYYKHKYLLFRSQILYIEYSSIRFLEPLFLIWRYITS